MRREITSPRRKIPQLNRGGGPGRGRGRVQLAARRSLYDRSTVSTADVVEMAFARKLLIHGRRAEPHDYRLARAAIATSSMKGRILCLQLSPS
jgi:hypothetical protein